MPANKQSTYFVAEMLEEIQSVTILIPCLNVIKELVKKKKFHMSTISLNL